MNASSRYARQISVPGIGERGQEAIRRASVRVEGNDLAAEVCALYLAGAGVRALEVDAAIADRCRALNADVAIATAAGSGALCVHLAGGASFGPPNEDDPVMRGSIAARWALARILEQGSAPEGATR